jgi:trehalose transport system substrate-binding protein
MSSSKTTVASDSSGLLLFLILICLILCSLSCARKGTGPAEITLAVALLPSEQPGYVSILHTFTEQTGIRVRLVAQQYAEIRSAVEAEAQAGRGQLDVAELDVYLLPILRPFMQPLDSLMATVFDLRKHVQKDVWNTGVFGNEAKKVYFVPHRLNWQALFYDATVIAVPPDDWDALLTIARAHSGKIGFKFSKYEGLVCDVFPILWQAGGDPLHPNTIAALKAMEFLRQLLPFVNPAARTYKENSILDAQEHQEIVLHMNWPFAVPLLRERGILNTKVKTAPLPKGPAGHATILGGGFLGIPATAPHPKEAAKLLDFLTSVQTQRNLAASLGWFPIRPEGWERMSEPDKVDYAGFLAMRDYVRPRPNVPYYEQVSQIWQDGIYEILFEGHDAKQTLAGMQMLIDKAAGGKSP